MSVNTQRDVIDVSTLRVAVAGASGYVGGELLRLLLGHPNVRIGNVTGAGSAGSVVGDFHRHLVPLAGTKIVETTPENLQDHEVVFLALPHGQSAEVVEGLAPDVLVVDCSADFRLGDEDSWAAYYGTKYAGLWPYGLPELPAMRDRLRRAKRVAVPGCYPTACILGLAPALGAGLVLPDVVIVAASGVSGAGRVAKPNLLGSELMGSMSAYGVGGAHRHTPEIREQMSALAGRDVTVSFSPLLAPMARGIISTMSAPLRESTSIEAVRATYEVFCNEEQFMHLLPTNEWPSTAATLGSNAVHVQIAIDEGAKRLIVVVALDNLTKGSAGGAIRNMNIMTGLPEETGLSVVGVAP